MEPETSNFELREAQSTGGSVPPSPLKVYQADKFTTLNEIDKGFRFANYEMWNARIKIDENKPGEAAKHLDSAAEILTLLATRIRKQTTP